MRRQSMALKWCLVSTRADFCASRVIAQQLQGVRSASVPANQADHSQFRENSFGKSSIKQSVLLLKQAIEVGESRHLTGYGGQIRELLWFQGIHLWAWSNFGVFRFVH
jgi:hypothetical protein